MSLEVREYCMAGGPQVPIYIFRAEDGQIWFKGKECANILEYGNSKKAIANNVDDDDTIEWRGLKQNYTHLPTNLQPQTIFINESGLYQLVMRSRKKQAVPFRNWVTRDILPMLRARGAVVVSDQDPSKQLNNKYMSPVGDISELISMIRNRDDVLLAKIDAITKDVDENRRLMNTLLKKKHMAIMPVDTATRHSFRVLRKKNNPNSYKFVRSQRRHLKSALKNLENEYMNILTADDVPNAVNILNRIKEQLQNNNMEYKAYSNTIVTPCDLLPIVSNLLKSNGDQQAEVE